MSEQDQSGATPEAVEATLRQELAHGDVVIATAKPILRHLLANVDQALFSDEVTATIRGMMRDLARQMLFHLAEVSDGGSDRAAFAEQYQNDLSIDLLDHAEFLAHAHAITIEAHIATRLSQRSGIDPVLSPLLQELAASNDEIVAAEAMNVLAAQARFMQQQRRMELPLTELPVELFERAMQVFDDFCVRHAMSGASAVHAMRNKHDPEQRRVARIKRLVSSMQHNAKRALEVDHAGLSIFVTALGMASEQARETAILSLGENQCARLAIGLRAAGLGQSAVEEQFLFLHPEITLPEGFDALHTDRAIAILSEARIEGIQ
ncbi:hypothetical protein [Aurantiacibacter sp. D1-12]|uniref:hypothetical protein n=1 Tax=Aurantiacibacter sp. D1-12 TaxID=2993658 RepID=UPI00237C60A6|nr:hypothetical protein [Aurantiacibacter sp. D1-12]MDE1466637.1 hypothetical protein [Aurantiacibacter sp. D1-12]